MTDQTEQIGMTDAVNQADEKGVIAEATAPQELKIEEKGASDMTVADPDGANDEDDKRELNIEELVEKGKRGKLSDGDLEEVLEESDYDLDTLDTLYEKLEDNGIPLTDDLTNAEINEIESEVEHFGGGENMERILEQEGLAIDDPVRLYLKSAEYRFWTQSTKKSWRSA